MPRMIERPTTLKVVLLRAVDGEHQRLENHPQNGPRALVRWLERYEKVASTTGQPGDVIKVGTKVKDEDAGFNLSGDGKVSPNHLEIKITADGFTIIDNSSARHGTFIEDPTRGVGRFKRIRGSWLRPMAKTEIAIGNAHLIRITPPDWQPATAPFKAASVVFKPKPSRPRPASPAPKPAPVADHVTDFVDSIADLVRGLRGTLGNKAVNVDIAPKGLNISFKGFLPPVVRSISKLQVQGKLLGPGVIPADGGRYFDVPENNFGLVSVRVKSYGGQHSIWFHLTSSSQVRPHLEDQLP